MNFQANLLPRSIFIHAPKTGGTWIREHFNEQSWWQQLGRGHGTLADFPDHARHHFAFTFVRHPRPWIISYWRFRQVQRRHKRPVCQVHGLLAQHWDDNLDQFLRNLLRRMPTAADMVFTRFTAGCDFVGRTENLCEDLITALRIAGETHIDYNHLRRLDTDRRNVHGSTCGPIYDPDLMQKFIQENPRTTGMDF